SEKIARLEKNSTNSSKPPSSDITKPPKKEAEKGQKRTAGAQKGHKKHERPPFPPEQIDHIIVHELSHCPCCGGRLKLVKENSETRQQIELVSKPYQITENRYNLYWCEECQAYHTAEIAQAERNLFGPELMAVTAYLKGRGHLSYTTIQAVMKDIVGIQVSRGFLANQIARVSESLKKPYEELAEQLPDAGHLHVDETGWKESGKQEWVWAFRGALVTVFTIAGTRGSEVLEAALGNGYEGIVSCDFWGAYKKYARKLAPLAMIQFCWAHLIREIVFLAENGDRTISGYGKRLLREVKKMYETIHRREGLTKMSWKRRMNKHRRSIEKAAAYRVPGQKDAQNLSKRMKEWGGSYFTFIDKDIPSTNNAAEQVIRAIVIDRKVTQGSRSEWGNRWMERFWSILTTCGQQGKPVIDFLYKCVYSGLNNLPSPSLLQG
ncbi:MAG: IS66 family transposase, partial [Treponema sp.]|nr:IS66 family transposase [Treponema sp.]